MRTRAVVRVCPMVISALRNVARFAASYVRPLSDWPGATGTMYPVIDSLVQHLLARYPVPRFLVSVWYGAGTDDNRRWFVAHAAGKRFRDLDLPLVMTRRMESIFLGSPDHLSLEGAMRRAELLSLGAKDDLVAAVLATRLGSELANAAFWRTVMEFFVRVSDRLDPDGVGPVVDFLQAVRHERVEVMTGQGPRLVPPPEPGFSIKGRSLASVQRLVDVWHRRVGRQVAGAVVWPRSRQQPLTFEERRVDPALPPVRWELVELTSSIELRLEGQALQHCVATYAHYCAGGLSRIWSLRRVSGSSQASSIATIEVDPRVRAIVQARGLRNRAVSGRARAVISLWAQREKLELRC